jgi:rhodanese-related sulfurtransferase
MNSTVTISQLRNDLSTPALLVDVRSGTEFASGHIPGAVNIPMDQIEARLEELGPNLDVPIVLICQSGKRARMTAGLLEPCQRQIRVLEGGTQAWIQAGLPVVASVRTRWSLERQVRLGAGLLVLAGAILALTANLNWVFLCGFAGLGLTFAGSTDICPMAFMLERMPWNRRSHCPIGGPKAAPSEIRP